MLRRADLICKTKMRRYLLQKTQHIVGGFGKGVGEPPGERIDQVVVSNTNN